MKGLRHWAVLFLLLVGCGGGGSSEPAPFETNLEFKNEICDYLPENDIKIDVSVKSLNGINEQVFNALLDEVESVYSPIVQQKGARLVVKRLWSNPDFNAKAYRQGRDFVIEMYGGLARHSEVTRDAVALVACHEIGHHLGGAPKYNGTDWASNEGQSDYFATMKCLRKVFEKYPAEPTGFDIEAENRCKEHHSASEKTICMRSALAGLAMARAMAAAGNDRVPRLDIKDNRRVSKTQDSHPAAQCRLDTYFQGGLCEQDDNTDFNDRNPNVGACTYDGGDAYGARPLCWYKPVGGGNPVPTPPTPTPTPGPGPTPTPTPIPSPPPGDGLAGQPLINGQNEIVVRDPRQSLRITWDVSNISGAQGVYVEFSRPNQSFGNPNGNTQDPNALGGTSVAQVRGNLIVVPARQLPGWGVYQIRVIALDPTGRRPVSSFSNSSVLDLRR